MLQAEIKSTPMDPDARLLASLYYKASSRNLEEDLATLAAHPQGIVLMMPQLVVLMKPTHSKHPEHWTNLAHQAAGADAWYVHLLVGNLSLARTMAAHLPLKQWLCFQRGTRNSTPHRIPWRRFLNQSVND